MNRHLFSYLLILFTLAAVTLPLPLRADEPPFPLLFTPSPSDLGPLEHGTINQFQVEISSRSEKELTLRMIPTCGCLGREVLELTLAPGEKKVLELSFDSTGIKGSFEKFFIIRIDAPFAGKALYAVTGSVKLP